MNRFATTALALVAAGSAVYADPGDNEWLELDGEINNLASSLQPSQDGMGWTALIRIAYLYSNDEILTGLTSDDPNISGLNFKDVDVALWGSVGDYGWRISVDIGDNEAGAFTDNDIELEDGYVFWNCGEYFVATLGQQQPYLLRSNEVDPENLLFIDRTALGSAVDFWDPGVSALGTWEQFRWSVGAMNGADGHIADHFYWARAEMLFNMGAGIYEGAMGASDELNGTLGVSYFKNDTQVPGSGVTTGIGAESSAILADVNGSLGQFGFGAEIAKLDDDFLATTDEDYMGVPNGLPTVLGATGSGLVFGGDSTPWNVTASFLINSEWEVGVRYESLDNTDALPVVGLDMGDHTILSACVNWYQTGKNAKWQAQWSDVDADSGFPDGSVVQVGVSIGASR